MSTAATAAATAAATTATTATATTTRTPSAKKSVTTQLEATPAQQQPKAQLVKSQQKKNKNNGGQSEALLHVAKQHKDAKMQQKLGEASKLSMWAQRRADEQAAADADALNVKRYRVHIDAKCADDKYVIALLLDEKTQLKTFVLLSMPQPYHSMVVEKYEDDVLSATNEVMHRMYGGGILTLARAQTTIHTYGTSGSYGKPDLALLRRILEACPETAAYTLSLTVTNYIRG
jgi:hypothetical protein